MSTFKGINFKNGHSARLKRKRGSQIAEIPPALIIIFFFFFFPILNLLYLSLAFGAGWFLNNIELRSVACRLPSSLGLFPPTGQYITVANLPESQNWNGLMGVTEDTPANSISGKSPEVAQFPLSTNPNAVGISKVRTTVSIRPFIVMPFFAQWPFLSQIPGLGKPIVFTYYGTIQQQEQGP